MKIVISKLIYILLCYLLFISEGKAKNVYAAVNQLPHAELAVVGDLIKTKQNSLTILVKQVLKGDSGFRNKIIRMPKCLKLDDIRGLFFKRNKIKNQTVLFRKGWIDKPCGRPIISVYGKSQLPFIKVLAQYKAISNEKKRLKKVLKLIPTEIYAMERIAFEQYKAMKNPKNFYLFSKFINKFENCQDKSNALNVMTETYDLRAVPYLIKLLSSDDCELNLRAAYKLTGQFAGANGVAKAFTKQINHPKIGKIARKYLSDRYLSPDYFLKQRAKNKWLLGEELLEAGDYSAATELFLSYMLPGSQSDCNNGSTTPISAILKVLPYLSILQQNRVFKYISSIDVSSDDVNFYFKRGMAEFLFEYPGSKNLPTLLALLEVSILNNDAFNFIILNLIKMDEKAKNEALIVLERMFKENRRIQQRILIGMYWLGGGGLIDKVVQENGKKKTSMMKIITALRLIPGSVNEFDFLKAATVSPEINKDWRLMSLIIKSLEEIGGEGVVNVMLQLLNQNYKGSRGAIQKAFISIDTDQAHQVVIELMSSRDAEVRSFATMTLFELKQQNSLPYMRKAFKRNDYGDKSKAIYALGLIGEVQDIKKLRPLCNYWQQPRNLSSRSCVALSRLMRLHHYDLNGPIVKLSKQTPFD
ncbi:MAG: HEAT repeat domain-containing protein [Proteobacteria bacterium]|nr:HEAT repeat domain-containing protein [Pseudomonadota bacterium]